LLKHRKVHVVHVSKRKRNTSSSIPEDVLQQKSYKVTLMSSRHTPPTLSYDLVAISPEEAFGKAISIANAHMQGSIMNNFMELTGKALTTLVKGEELTEEQMIELRDWSVDHNQFQVDGVMVINTDKIQGEVMASGDIADDIADGFEKYLKEKEGDE